MQSIDQLLAFLAALARACLRHALAVVLSLVVCIGGAVAVAIVRPPQYANAMTVKAAEEQVEGSANVTLHVPGLSALGGTLATYLKLLQSHEVAQLMIDRERFDRTLFWGRVDPATGRWTAPPSFLHRAVDGLFGIAAAPGPDADDVQHALTAMLVINKDLFSDLATVSCTAPSPTLCTAMLGAAHRQTEYRLRQVLLAQAYKTRAFVAAALPTTTDPHLRATMTAALAEANDRILAADLTTPAGAILLEPPAALGRRLYPQPGVVLTLGALLGLAVGMALAWWRETRPRRAP